MAAQEKPWWIWRWLGGGGNSVPVAKCPTRAKALKYARGMTKVLVPDEATLHRATQEELNQFDRELYLMWC